MDSYGAKDNKHYELSVAMSASPKMMAAIEYEKVLKIVDFANMMTYDLMVHGEDLQLTRQHFILILLMTREMQDFQLIHVLNI